MTHVLDDLELYGLGALPAEAADRVARHLTRCASCRAAAAEIADVVGQLPDAIPLREPPPGLKARILEAARADAVPRRFALRLPWSLPRLGVLAMAAALVALVAVDIDQALTVRSLQAERAEYESVLADVAHGGRSWYMAGVDAWAGSGGDLVQPSNGEPAFVVFHGLPDIPSGQTYAVWLISPTGQWMRAASFRPDGNEVQTLRLAIRVNDYARCVVTMESAPEGGDRAGPVVMASTP